MSNELDAQLWAAHESAYEPGSRSEFSPEGRPDLVDALRAVSLYVVQLAAEELVKRDCFTERTLRILDDLGDALFDGEHQSTLDPEWMHYDDPKPSISEEADRG